MIAILLIIFLIWFIGWVFSIYPIYCTLTRIHQEHLYNQSRHDPLDRSDVARGLAGAFGLGMFWYVVIPIYLSFAIHRGRRPRLAEEVDRQIDNYKDEIDHKAALKEALAVAKLELEEETGGRDYDDHWPTRRPPGYTRRRQ